MKEKRMTKNRVLVFILSLIMLISAINIPVLNVNAEEKPKAGDIIVFGKYEQDGNTSNGKEDIEWRVLSVEGDRILVLSEYVLDCMPYNDSNSNCSWESCSLRNWLNDDFIKTAFSSDEKNKIPTVTLSNNVDSDYHVDGGNDTYDKVFCLSYDDTVNYLATEKFDFSYLASSPFLICSPTNHAITKGIQCGTIDEDYFNSMDFDRYYYPKDVIGYKSCNWWLRTSSQDDNNAWWARFDGILGESFKLVAHYSYYGVRPAIYIDDYNGDIKHPNDYKSETKLSKDYLIKANGGSEDLHIEYHTKTEIAKYLKNHPVDNAYKVIYDEEPNATYPYSLGKVSDITLKDTCQLVNNIRYIAGVPSDVTLKNEYIELAQAASVVNAANDMMTHYPSCPNNMSDAMFQKGYNGASHSNLCRGSNSIGMSILGAYMGDRDSSNIDRVGHRRWILDPYMSQTGFGYAKNIDKYTAMYALDTGNENGKNYDNIVWPAQNTPIGYFNGNDPWSISVNGSVDTATVSITCINTGQKWTFSGEPGCKKDNDIGYFNINNEHYGMLACIIFRPKGGVEVSNGYSYKVEVTGSGYDKLHGNKDISINYTVDFFEVEEYANKNELTAEQKSLVKEFVKRFYKEVLGREGEEAGINDWTNKLIASERSGADVAKGFAMSKEFKNKNLSNDEFVKTMYKAFFDREPDEGGYNGWMQKLNSGVSREAVIAGFVNSQEFKNLCNKYGINPGTMEVSEEGQKIQQPTNQNSTALKLDASGVDDAKLDEYVERLYTKILGRNSEAEGKEYWKKVIIDGKDSNGNVYDAATAARKGFFESKEYKNKNRTDDEFLTDLYWAFFNREPDEDGYKYWQNKMKNEGYSRQRVIDEGFGHSKEFKNLLISYGFKIIE